MHNKTAVEYFMIFDYPAKLDNDPVFEITSSTLIRQGQEIFIYNYLQIAF